MTAMAIEANGLTRYFGDVAAVDRLNLRVPAGSVVGLLGRNGAGKTTTIKMLLGLLAPTRGGARVLGCDSASLTPEVLARVGYLPENHPMFGWMTLEGAARFFAGFYPQWRQETFGRIVEFFGLPLGRKVRQLSRGERAQAALALTVAREPELLILDDPTQGVDPVARREFLSALVALIRRERRTILFSSHLLGDVERVCDRVVVIHHGVLRADCAVDTFKQSIRRVLLPSGAEPPAVENVPGLLGVERCGEGWAVTLVDRDGSRVGEITRRVGGPVQAVEMNLEDAFIAFTTERHKRRLDLTEA